MKKMLLGLLLPLCLSWTVFASEGNISQFQQILDTNCSQCHTRERIEAAMRGGVNYDETIQKMIRFGAKISAQERQVLGVFWQTQEAQEDPGPALQSSGRTVSKDPLGEFRAVLDSRCTGCHTLDRVEEAMLQDRSIADLIEMMRQRGAIVTEADKNVLGTFWGNPLKVTPE